MGNGWDFLLVAMAVVVWTAMSNNYLITKDDRRFEKKSSKFSNDVRPTTRPDFIII